MEQLVIINIILILIIVGLLILFKKVCKTDKSKYILLLILPLITIVCHYSSLVYHQIKSAGAMDFLINNPNLVLPIYPCNVVMWLALVYGIIKNKQTKFSMFLADYIFWFGMVSAFVGMTVNIDFFNNPTLLDYDVTKGILAHAAMLLNVLTLSVLGFIKIRLEKNLLHILISIIMMFVIGLYCNLLITVIGSEEFAYNVNSMFLIHSPFEAVPFLTYPLISLVAFVLYFITFAICEMFVYKKGSRWYNRLLKQLKIKK